MAHSRSRNSNIARSESTPARLPGTSHQPTITVDSGTPIRTSHPYSRGARDQTSKFRSAGLKEELPHALTDFGSSSAEESLSPVRPRPSIDDDNGEGDPDLTSPVVDADTLGLSGSEDLEDEEEDDETPNGAVGPSGREAQASSLQRSNSTPILISAPHNAFAPPFYNRPPTPLPPSPSLTSLLRPSFSSRPTTPDDSESEVVINGIAGQGLATEAAVAKSARDARTIPRASPKVPTYEYYGFVLYLTSGLCFLVYLLWSYLPSPFLHQLGIYYYPNRWWSLAVPAFLVMLIMYIYVALAMYNVEYLTPRLGSMTNLVDEAANVAAIKPNLGVGASAKGNRNIKRAKSLTHDGDVRTEGNNTGTLASAPSVLPDWKAIWNEGTDAVMDVPIGGICEILYGDM